MQQELSPFYSKITDVELRRINAKNPVTQQAMNNILALSSDIYYKTFITAFTSQEYPDENAGE